MHTDYLIEITLPIGVFIGSVNKDLVDNATSNSFVQVNYPCAVIERQETEKDIWGNVIEKDFVRDYIYLNTDYIKVNFNTVLFYRYLSLEDDKEVSSYLRRVRQFMPSFYVERGQNVEPF